MRYVEVIKSGVIDGKWYEPGERYVILNGVPDLRKDLMVNAGNIDNEEKFACSFERTQRQHEEGEPLRVGIMNSFGTGIGDMICGSVALRVLLKNMIGFAKVEIYPFPWRTFAAREIFGNIPEVTKIQSCGYREDDAPHLLISFEDILVDEDFNRMPMIDYFLKRLGVLELAGKEDKIPQLAIDDKLCNEVRLSIAPHAGKLLLLNFHASGHRRIPYGMWDKFVKLFIDEDYHILLPCGLNEKVMHDEMCKKLAKDYPGKIQNVSDFTSQSLKHLFATVKVVDAVVTPDTGIMHIAGALRKPCAAVFFSIDPELRVSYYPTVEGWCPDHFKKTRWWNKHKITDDPEVNDPKELETDDEFIKAWRKTDLTMMRVLLERAVGNA